MVAPRHAVKIFVGSVLITMLVTGCGGNGDNMVPDDVSEPVVSVSTWTPTAVEPSLPPPQQDDADAKARKSRKTTKRGGGKRR